MKKENNGKELFLKSGRINNMEFYNLYYYKTRKSEKSLHLMCDSLVKVNAFIKAREVQNTKGRHVVEKAGKGAVAFKRSASFGDKKTGGYIQKGGFQQNT